MMERRDFLGTLAGGVLLAGAPVFVRSAAATPASAASPATTIAPSACGESVLVVHRSDLPGATALAVAIVGSLREAGTPATMLGRRAEDLASFASIDTVLREANGSRIAGVMDDAGALLFQQLAASQGCTWLVEGQHRFEGADVRHRLHAAGAAPALAWSEPAEGWAPRIARHYAGIVTGRPAPRRIDAGAASANAEANGTGLVSFVIDSNEIPNGRSAR